LANFSELRHGEVHSGVNFAQPHPGRARTAAKSVPTVRTRLFVYAYIKPAAAGVRVREGLEHRGGAKPRVC
jgi:hypothetical protein